MASVSDLKHRSWIQQFCYYSGITYARSYQSSRVDQVDDSFKQQWGSFVANVQKPEVSDQQLKVELQRLSSSVSVFSVKQFEIDRSKKLFFPFTYICAVIQKIVFWLLGIQRKEETWLNCMVGAYFRRQPFCVLNKGLKNERTIWYSRSTENPRWYEVYFAKDGHNNCLKFRLVWDSEKKAKILECFFVAYKSRNMWDLVDALGKYLVKGTEMDTDTKISELWFVFPPEGEGRWVREMQKAFPKAPSQTSTYIRDGKWKYLSLNKAHMPHEKDNRLNSLYFVNVPLGEYSEIHKLPDEDDD
jgi:hypothetical protein